MWEKEEAINISGKKSKIFLIKIKVCLYEVFLSYNFLSSVLFINILTPFFLPDLWYLYHWGKEVIKLLTKSICFRIGKGDR